MLAIKHQLEEKTRALAAPSAAAAWMKSPAAARPSTPAMPCWRWRKTANSAEQLAAAETNAYRRAELLDSAAILHHVPAHPARSFKEACRAFICSSWRSSSITAATPSTRKAPTKPCSLTTSAISTTARSPRSRRMKSSNRCGSLAELCEVRAACAIDGYPMFDALLHGASLENARINELSDMFLSAQHNLSALHLPVRLFKGVQHVSAAPFAAAGETPAAEGLTPRMQRLRNHYLTVRPSVSIYRALAFTEVVKANPGMPTILLRAKAFRHACETAPILIQDDELIVGHPCGKPRAGAFAGYRPALGARRTRYHEHPSAGSV